MIKCGFAEKCEKGEDFLIGICPVYSYAENETKEAYAIGLKFGFWGVYIALLRFKKELDI